MNSCGSSRARRVGKNSDSNLNSCGPPRAGVGSPAFRFESEFIRILWRNRIRANSNSNLNPCGPLLRADKNPFGRANDEQMSGFVGTRELCLGSGLRHASNTSTYARDCHRHMCTHLSNALKSKCNCVCMCTRLALTFFGHPVCMIHVVSCRCSLTLTLQCHVLSVARSP